MPKGYTNQLFKVIWWEWTTDPARGQWIEVGEFFHAEARLEVEHFVAQGWAAYAIPQERYKQISQLKMPTSWNFKTNKWMEGETPSWKAARRYNRGWKQPARLTRKQAKK